MILAFSSLKTIKLTIFVQLVNICKTFVRIFRKIRRSPRLFDPSHLLESLEYLHFDLFNALRLRNLKGSFYILTFRFLPLSVFFLLDEDNLI